MDNKYDWPGEMFLKAKNDNILFHEYEEWIAHHIIMNLKNIDVSVGSSGIRRESTVKNKMSVKDLSAKSTREQDLSKSITPNNKTYSLTAKKFTETQTKKDTTLNLGTDNSYISSSNNR